MTEAAEHVEQSDDGVLLLLHKLVEPDSVDPWNRNMGTDAVHKERKDDKEQSVPELGAYARLLTIHSQRLCHAEPLDY